MAAALGVCKNHRSDFLKDILVWSTVPRQQLLRPVSEPEHQVTTTKPSRNDGASRAGPDAEDPFRMSDEEEGLGATKIRPPRHVLKYEAVKRWVTGERAQLDDDKINSQDQVREHMELSASERFLATEQI